MSLGSRLAKRGRTVVCGNLVSPPAEPLLFLYPVWSRAFSTTTSTLLQQDGSSVPRHREPESARHQPAKSIGQAIVPAQGSNDTVTITRTRDAHGFKKAPSAKARPPNITTTDGILSIQQQHQHHPKSTHKSFKNASAAENTVRKVVSVHARTKGAQENRRKVRKAYQAFRSDELATWLPDWRVVLTDLNKHTPQYGPWLSKALRFIVPSSAASQLLHGLDDHFLDIGSTYGCHIALGERDEETDEYRNLIISGPAVAISKCAAEILRVAPEVKIVPTSKLVTETRFQEALDDGSGELISRAALFDSGVSIRNVVSEHQYHSAKVAMRLGDVWRPEKWTPVLLVDYIRKLRAAFTSKHVNRDGFASKLLDRNGVITDLIRKLFTDPDCKSSITQKACHEAMGHFISITRIEDVRILFVRMEMLKLKMVPETFNIMLAGAAKSEDFHNFHFILHLMLHRGSLPNGRTWTTFMSATPDVRIKLHILSAMQKKGLLNNIQTLREACAHLAFSEMESSIDLSQTQDAFVAHMDSRYGPLWLSVNAANRILHSLGARGLISRCYEFLHFMDSRNVVPERYSVNTILHFCKQSTNLSGAVEVLQSLPRSMGFVPDEESYRILFELAWRSRSYNVAKVIWRYACLSSSTSFRMRARIFGSMKNSNSVEVPDTSRERWNKFVGPAVIGTNSISEHPMRCLHNIFCIADKRPLAKTKTYIRPSFIEDIPIELESSETTITSPELEDFTAISNIPSESGLRPALQSKLPKLYSPWAPSMVGKRLPSYKLPVLQELLNADLDICRSWQPVKPFSKMLAAALELDSQWKAMDNFRDHDLEWLLDGKALRVPISTRSLSGGGSMEWR